jgi:hypothetical protein
MAARVNGAEVLEIFDSSIAEADLDPFITAANLLVNEKLISVGHSAELLKEIERWISAHFASMRDQLASEDSANDIKYEYRGDGLKLSRYGQQAILLDTSGTLAEMASDGGFTFVASVGSA